MRTFGFIDIARKLRKSTEFVINESEARDSVQKFPSSPVTFSGLIGFMTPPFKR